MTDPTVICYCFYSQVHGFKAEVLRRNVGIKGGLIASSMTDITTLIDGQDLTPSDALDYIVAGRNETQFTSNTGYLYRESYPKLVNSIGTAALIKTIPQGGSFNGGGEAVTRSVREVANLPEFAPYGFYIISDVSELLDGLDEVYSQIPIMMVSTVVVVVFGLSLLAFRSLLSSIRLLLTIGATIFLVYAVTVIVFQDVMKLSGIYWIVPIACGYVCKLYCGSM